MLKDTVSNILSNPFSVFCGAGISWHSGIPCAPEYVQALLNLFPLSEHQKEFINNRKLPFEAVMQVLLEASGSNKLLAPFSLGKPNNNHVLVAKLAKLGILKDVITTNFDQLFELALLQEGVSHDVYYTDNHFSNINWDESITKIIKLHGDINSPATLAVTIRNVSSQQRMTDRTKVLKQLLSVKRVETLVCLGYSCSDLFDIIPTIKSLSEKLQPIVYVQHCKEMLKGESTFESFPKEHAFSGFEGGVLRCNTDDFVETMWSTQFSTTPFLMSTQTHQWDKQLIQWKDESENLNGPCNSSYLAGLLLKEANKYEASNLLLKNALELTPPTALEAIIYNAIGNNYRDLAKYNFALEFLRRTLKYRSGKDGLTKTFSRAMASIGIVMNDQLDHVSAIHYNKRAAKFARKIRDFELEGKCYGNIGIAIKNMGGDNNLRKAIRFHENALRIACNHGDKRSEGRTFGNLGIAYSNLNNKAEALKYYEEAINVARSLGDDRHVGIWLANSGMDYIGIDNSIAKNQLLNAIQTFEMLGGLDKDIATCKESLLKIPN